MSIDVNIDIDTDIQEQSGASSFWVGRVGLGVVLGSMSILLHSLSSLCVSSQLPFGHDG